MKPLEITIEHKVEKPEVTQRGVLDMQVCVPNSWTDEEIIDFANANNPCGTENGWFIRKEGDELLAGCSEKVSCMDEKRNKYGYVHIMLDC